MSKSPADLPYQLEDTYILQFGNIYFYEKFVITEIDEGVFFDKNKAILVADIISGHYENRLNIGYISNRVNQYKVGKEAWNVYAERKLFSAYATIPKVKESFWDKLFGFNKNLVESGSFDCLLEAACWITSLNILIKNNKVQKPYISPSRNRTYLL